MEVVGLLALVGGTLGKVAWEVMMLASTEFGEVAEPFVDGRGASSTMPQKRNPISSELMFAAAKLLRERAGSMLDAMVQDFERQHAHDVVYAACRTTIESGTSLADQLLTDGDLRARLGEETIRALTDPAGYLGSAREMTRRVIDRPDTRTDRSSDPEQYRAGRSGGPETLRG